MQSICGSDCCSACPQKTACGGSAARRAAILSAAPVWPLRVSNGVEQMRLMDGSAPPLQS